MKQWQLISQAIQGDVDALALAGASIHVVKDGETVLLQGFGLDQVDSIYRIYSMTKLATVIAVFKLYENGQLQLTDPLSKYLPGFKDHLYYDDEGNLSVGREITIQHLLDMTSGMSYPGNSLPGERRMAEFEQEIILRMKSGVQLSTKDIMNLVGQIASDYNPGSSWAYGISADILGGVIEVVTGKRLSQVFDELIFQPLGMTDTAFYVPEDKRDRVSVLTIRDPLYQDYKVFPRPVINETAINYLTLPLVPEINGVEPQFLSGGGGLYSTATDFSKLAQCLLNKGSYGQKEILKKETVEEMTQIPEDSNLYTAVHKNIVGANIPGYSYHNLLRILKNPEEARVLGVNGNRGEYGWDGAGGNLVVIDPVANLTLVFMMQDLSCANPILRRRIYQLINQSI